MFVPLEGSPNGMAVVLKTTVRKDLGVQIPRPPLFDFFYLGLDPAQKASGILSRLLL